MEKPYSKNKEINFLIDSFLNYCKDFKSKEYLIFSKKLKKAIIVEFDKNRKILNLINLLSQKELLKNNFTCTTQKEYIKYILSSNNILFDKTFLEYLILGDFDFVYIANDCCNRNIFIDIPKYSVFIVESGKIY